MGPSDSSSLTDAQGRAISLLLLLGGIAVFYAESLPGTVRLLVVGLLGAGVVFLVAPAWTTGRWEALRDWFQSR